MGERKVLNKYYPPDFDPAKIPRAQWPKNQQIKVRMMLPMSIRCNICGTYIYKGTKFNSRKEDVVGETYLGIQIFRFYFKCTKCSVELTMRTDPQNSDYVVESGAARNYEPWRATNEVLETERRKREAEEMGDSMKSLENRAHDSKQDMDIMASLEEMRSLKSRHATVSIDDVLATLHHIKQEKEQKMMDEVDKADEEVIKAIVFSGHKKYARRIPDDEEDEDEDNFNEKEKSTLGVPSIMGKPTDTLTKTSIFNSSKNNEEASNDINIQAYSDADWANDLDDHISTSGYCALIGPNPVSWCTRKQKTVSRSNTEAEYRSVASVAAEIIWIETLILELGFKFTRRPIVWCDNLSTISLSANPSQHSRTKHMEIDLHFVRERTSSGKLEVRHVPSFYQRADILTKALSARNFIRLKDNLKIIDGGDKKFEDAKFRDDGEKKKNKDMKTLASIEAG